MARQRLVVGYALVVGILGWIALLLQFPLHLQGSLAMGNSVGIALLNFFSYFTILSNILVALALTVPFLFTNSKSGRFLSNSHVVSGIAVCITVVGIVYNGILRHIWNPQGLQLIVDNLLHTVLPLLFVFYWYLIVPSKTWSWRALCAGAFFPLGYLGFSLVRGAADGWYPYPFLNADNLGYERALTNSVFVLILFTAIGGLLWIINRIKP